MDRLHGHVHARYDREPGDLAGGPVWRYPSEVRDDPACAYNDAGHGGLRAAITARLERLAAASY